jgi:hypothetical protein
MNKRIVLLSVLGIFLTPNIFLYAGSSVDKIVKICKFDEVSKQKFINGGGLWVKDLAVRIINNQVDSVEKSCTELRRMCGDHRDLEAFTKDETNCTNGGFVIVDNHTGLMWLGNANDYNGGRGQNWHDAMKNVKDFNYCGHADWRLPNKDELKTFADYASYEPAKWLNNNGFANITIGGHYWSSSYFQPNTGNSWVFSMYTGRISEGGKGGGFQVLPVRGPTKYETPLTKDETNCTNDGFVMVDNKTGLMWLGNANDFHGGKRQSWYKAMEIIKSFSYCGYTDWRLPSKDELKTLAHYVVYEQHPVKWLNTIGFANIASESYENYWSSSTTSYKPDVAWSVSMSDGGARTAHKGGNGFRVLPVREPTGD